MSIKATALRQNLYHLLDEILSTGRPLEIERHGKLLRISPVDAVSKLSRLEPHDLIVGNSDDLVNMDWSSSWSGEFNLSLPEKKPKTKKNPGKPRQKS